jgi:hypothetical protein
LIKEHEDFSSSINNQSFYPMLEHSFKKTFNKKFNYKMLSEKRSINIHDEDMKEKISNHILLLGYNKGCDQFIKSVREESDIPIAILSDTTSMVDITNVTLMYPNILHFEGDPSNMDNLKNSNIGEACHVIIPCKAEVDLNGTDCNAVIKANTVNQNWPGVKVSVEFSSNLKAALIENILDHEKDLLFNDGSSIYTSRSYQSGKIFSSVLFTRMLAMKSIENL